MIKSNLVNIACDNELITAEIVNEESGLYRSLNITMGEVNIFDIVEAKKENGVLKFIAVREEGVPHKAFFNYKNQKDWVSICMKAVEISNQCLLQPLVQPKGEEPGVVVMAYEDDFNPSEYFGELIQPFPTE